VNWAVERAAGNPPPLEIDGSGRIGSPLTRIPAKANSSCLKLNIRTAEFGQPLLGRVLSKSHQAGQANHHDCRMHAISPHTSIMVVCGVNVGTIWTSRGWTTRRNQTAPDFSPTPRDRPRDPPDCSRRRRICQPGFPMAPWIGYTADRPMVRSQIAAEDVEVAPNGFHAGRGHVMHSRRQD